MAKGSPRASLAWAPTIALSWLWGLGFFYAIHVILVDGIMPFLVFATANAVGLGLFGFVTDRFSRKGRLDSFYISLWRNYAPILTLYQVMALALSLAVVSDLVWKMLYPVGSVFAGVAVFLVALLIGLRARLDDLRRRHAWATGAALLLLGGVLAILAAAPLPALGTQAPTEPVASSFWTYALPLVIGFLVGPWSDIQHWQRAVAIKQSGGSPAWAYGAGALLFFAMLGANATLAVALVPSTSAFMSLDWANYVHAGGAVVGALARSNEAVHGVALLVFGGWAVLAVVSTVESAVVALRDAYGFTKPRSEGLLAALVPAALLQFPLFGLAVILVTLIGSAIPLSLLMWMAPFGSFFILFSATVLAATWTGRAIEPLDAERVLLATLALIIGGIGYVNQLAPALLLAAMAPLVFVRVSAIPFAAGPDASAPPKAISPAAAPDGPSRGGVIAPASLNAMPSAERAAQHAGRDLTAGYFDGKHFIMPIVATYDDTNSVGNVYFARYLVWVGKARELFFRACMPQFDLGTTSYYILTRSVTHKYVRETREFDRMVVRIFIKSHNRKFVTLAHEIQSASGDVIGQGEQTLMFVRSDTYDLVDLPSEVYQSFVAYA